MAAREARRRRVCEPRGERVPPLIVRAITGGRIARSAAVWSGGTSGWRTPVSHSSWKCHSRQANGRQGGSRRATNWAPSAARSACRQVATHRRRGRLLGLQLGDPLLVLRNLPLQGADLLHGVGQLDRQRRIALALLPVLGAQPAVLFLQGRVGLIADHVSSLAHGSSLNYFKDVGVHVKV